jgi:hypothetical protein
MVDSGSSPVTKSHVTTGLGIVIDGHSYKYAYKASEHLHLPYWFGVYKIEFSLVFLTNSRLLNIP